MKQLFRIFFLFISITSLSGHTQPIYNILEKAIFEKSQANFDSAIIEYCQQYKPNDINLITNNDTLRNLFKIYSEFYVSLFQDTLSDSRFYDYFLIPQIVKIGFVKDIETKVKGMSDNYYKNAAYKYFLLLFSYDSILKSDYLFLYNFRPKLSLNKTVLYLDSTLDHVINKLFFKIYDNDTLRKQNYLAFFDNIPQVWFGQGTFDIGSAPHLDLVLFDKKMKKSIFYYKFMGEQFAMILKKKKKGWRKVFQGFLLVY